MHDILFSPYIVPLGAFAVGIAAVGFGSWKKVRELELNHNRELRHKEMEHQQKMKELEVDLVRLKEGQNP